MRDQSLDASFASTRLAPSRFRSRCQPISQIERKLRSRKNRSIKGEKKPSQPIQPRPICRSLEVGVNLLYGECRLVFEFDDHDKYTTVTRTACAHKCVIAQPCQRLLSVYSVENLLSADILANFGLRPMSELSFFIESRFRENARNFR